MEINELKQLLIWSWEKDTCSPGQQAKWSEATPSLGQCAVTALIVQDFFGGKIMRCMTSTGTHYYNIIDNEVVDLTASQFKDEVPNYEQGEERTREYLLSNEDTKKRYLLLNKYLKRTIDEENRIRENRFKMCVKQRQENEKETLKKTLKILDTL